jgi:hypothetical protein
MYTANAKGKIALSLDGKDISGKLLVRSTYNFKETVPWKQWHHWNKDENLATITLQETHFYHSYCRKWKYEL